MRRRTPVPLAAALLVALVVAACGSSPADAPAGTARPTAGPGAASAAPDPGAAQSPAVDPGSPAPDPDEASPAPATSDAPAASDAPATSDAPDPPDASAAVPPGAEGCSGSAENRDFYDAAADSMSWDVYCAVLADGWFVEAGSYRLADGGRLEVTYRGPGGERIEIREGAWCTADAASCAPRASELGPASFGDRAGVLVALGGSEADGFAVHVDAGKAPSWSILGRGMDAAGLVAIAAALHRVSE
jgi:hypothetical protein